MGPFFQLGRADSREVDAASRTGRGETCPTLPRSTSRPENLAIFRVNRAYWSRYDNEMPARVCLSVGGENAPFKRIDGERLGNHSCAHDGAANGDGGPDTLTCQCAFRATHPEGFQDLVTFPGL